MFNFDGTFEIHDDIEVLKRMGLALGLDKGECTDEDDMKDIKPHTLLFKAQSPDEAALVSAARDLGFVFLGRDRDLIFVSTLGQVEAIIHVGVFLAACRGHGHRGHMDRRIRWR